MSTGYTEESILTIVGELSSFQLCQQFFWNKQFGSETATFDSKPNYTIIESLSQHTLYYTLL